MPVVTFRGDESALSQWLIEEYRDALQSRRLYEAYLDEADRQYEQIPRVAQKLLPWKDASNLEVGVGASHVDTAISRIEAAYFSTQPYVLIRPMGLGYETNCAALQEFMNLISLPRGLYREEKSIDLLQSCKLGTSFQRVTYESRYKYTRTPSGRRVQHLICDGPVHTTIHPRDLIHPPDARNIQRARWIAIRSYKTWGEIEENVRLGIYDAEAVDAISGSATINPLARKREVRQGLRRTGKLREWHIVTSYAIFDGEDVCIDWQYPSGTILRAIYNPYLHMQWPIIKTVYMQREDAFIGLGIMQMLAMIQEEITTIHNYCLDNMLAANTVMIFAKKNSVADVTIGPMQVLEYFNNKDDVRVERLGQALSGQQVGEAAANAYAERRTGVADASVNRVAPSSGLSSSRTPATTTMALLGESNKRFELAIENNKKSDSDLLMQHVMLLKQYWVRQRRTADLWDRNKCDLIEQLFQLEDEAFRNKVVIEVSASTVVLNKETERQNMMILGQFMNSYYDLVIKYIAMIAQYPMLEPIIRKMLDGAAKFVIRLLRTFDIRDPETLIPSIDDIGSGATQKPKTVLDQLNTAFLTRTNGQSSNGNAVGSPDVGANGAIPPG